MRQPYPGSRLRTISSRVWDSLNSGGGPESLSKWFPAVFVCVSQIRDPKIIIRPKGGSEKGNLGNISLFSDLATYVYVSDVLVGSPFWDLPLGDGE